MDNGNYFGFPVTAQESALVLISAPWDVTSSYGAGAASAPDAIIGASTQIDFYDPDYPEGWRHGIGTVGINYSVQDHSAMLRSDARKVISHIESGGHPADDHIKRRTARINEASAWVNEYLYGEAKQWLTEGKSVGLVGGDHSTPLSLIRAVAEHEGEIGILHLDAHADLREAYEGFTYSHASIMYNVLKEVDGVTKIVQAGVRDLCEKEMELIETHPKLETFFGWQLAAERFAGTTWKTQCETMVAALPRKVYISFDIDALSPENCPNTGTPVPGGLSYDEAVYLLQTVVASGRKIVGFDLCEVSPSVDNEWDANVGARILYKLCNLTLLSNK